MRTGIGPSGGGARRLRGPVVIVALMALLLAGAPVQAITYGTDDTTNRFGNVGVLLIDGFPVCTGTYIGRQQGTNQGLFLTAAHCLDEAQQRVAVSFEPAYAAGDPTIAGTAHRNPGFSGRQGDPGDMAMVVLDRDPGGLTAARLPAVGFLDQLSRSRELRKKTFTAVGYGDCGPNDPNPSCAGGDAEAIRRFAESRYTTLTRAWLKLSQNNAQGYGGTCYGDSGGPNFWPGATAAAGDDVLVSLTVTGDAMCKATNVTYRLDTAAARAFIEGFDPPAPEPARAAGGQGSQKHGKQTGRRR